MQYPLCSQSSASPNPRVSGCHLIITFSRHLNCSHLPGLVGGSVIDTFLLTTSFSGPNCTSEGFKEFYPVQITELVDIWKYPPRLRSGWGISAHFPHHHVWAIFLQHLSTHATTDTFLKPILFSNHTLLIPLLSTSELSLPQLPFSLLYLGALICILMAPTFSPVYPFLIQTACVPQETWLGDLEITFPKSYDYYQHQHRVCAPAFWWPVYAGFFLILLDRHVGNM